MTIKTFNVEPYITKAMDYATYMALINDLLKEGKTTGPNQEIALVEYTRLNFHRMERLNKTIVLNENLLEAINHFNKRCTWLIITEAWCGDAAQNIPLMHAISVASKGKIELKLVLRDENLELMDANLTNGARAIPILICLETETLKPLFKWGPRPVEAQEMVNEFKKNPHQSIEEFKTLLHSWYAKNKNEALQSEMLKLIS